MTHSTYHKTPASLQHLCHYDVIKWNISSKYLDIKRKRALNITLPGSCTSFFFTSPQRKLDLDRPRQPYQAKEWHNLYYMHGDFSGGRPRRGYDELMARNYVWYKMAAVILCISIMLRSCQQPQRTSLTCSKLLNIRPAWGCHLDAAKPKPLLNTSTKVLVMGKSRACYFKKRIHAELYN